MTHKYLPACPMTKNLYPFPKISFIALIIACAWDQTEAAGASAQPSPAAAASPAPFNNPPTAVTPLTEHAKHPAAADTSTGASAAAATTKKSTNGGDYYSELDMGDSSGGSTSWHHSTDDHSEIAQGFLATLRALPSSAHNSSAQGGAFLENDVKTNATALVLGGSASGAPTYSMGEGESEARGSMPTPYIMGSFPNGAGLIYQPQSFIVPPLPPLPPLPQYVGGAAVTNFPPLLPPLPPLPQPATNR